MTITLTQEGSVLNVALSGRLDTASAPQLQAELVPLLPSLTKLVLDLNEVGYVSSAGLRVLLSLQKQMNEQRHMVLRNVCHEVHQVFSLTGLEGVFQVD